MQNRRSFIKIIFGFFITLFSFKYQNILKAMNRKPYHHLEDGTFRNLPGGILKDSTSNRGNRGFFYFFYKGIIKREMFDQKEIPDFIPNNHYISENKSLKMYKNNKDAYKITWLGHASFLLTIKNHVVLVDPFLSKTAGPFGIGPNRYIDPGISVKNLPKIDTILISHNHYDHLDIKTLKKINNKENIRVICPLNISKIFKKINYKNTIELDWYESEKHDKISFISVPAYHWSRRIGQKRNFSLWSGYIIDDGLKKIYFSGDTAYGTIFNKIGKEFGPFDLSILPIGAYEPRNMMKSSHCTPEEAVKISLMLKSKNILGMHWGTIRLSAENPWEPPKKFYNAAKFNGYNDNQIWQLAIGQTKTLI